LCLGDRAIAGNARNDGSCPSDNSEMLASVHGVLRSML
jgi:hypothetical protein